MVSSNTKKFILILKKYITQVCLITGFANFFFGLSVLLFAGLDFHLLPVLGVLQMIVNGFDDNLVGTRVIIVMFLHTFTVIMLSMLMDIGLVSYVFYLFSFFIDKI